MQLRELQKAIGEWSLYNFGRQMSKTTAFTIYKIAPKDSEPGLTPISDIVLPHAMNEKELISHTTILVEESTGNIDSICHIPVLLGSLAPLMGIVEEVGELSEARLTFLTAANSDLDVLKATQQKANEEFKDALGDIAVYLCDYCTREAVDLQHLVTHREEEAEEIPPVISRLTIPVGKLYHATLKHHQGIRGFDTYSKYALARNAAITDLWLTLESISQIIAQQSLLSILEETWNKVVSKRDWKKKPQTAHQ